MKRENIEMIKIIAFDVFANVKWTLAFRCGIGSKDKATNLWIRAQVSKANWCANHVWFGSDWHGLNCEIQFHGFKQKACITVELKETK